MSEIDEGEYGTTTKKFFVMMLAASVKLLMKLDVFADLDAHEVVELRLVCGFQGCDVRADVEHARLDEYFARRNPAS